MLNQNEEDTLKIKVTSNSDNTYHKLWEWPRYGKTFGKCPPWESGHFLYYRLL